MVGDTAADPRTGGHAGETLPPSTGVPTSMPVRSATLVASAVVAGLPVMVPLAGVPTSMPVRIVALSALAARAAAALRVMPRLTGVPMSMPARLVALSAWAAAAALPEMLVAPAALSAWVAAAALPVKLTLACAPWAGSRPPLTSKATKSRSELAA